MSKELKACCERLVRECSDLDGIEINIMQDNIVIYFENIRVPCTPANVYSALKAIKTLSSLGMYFE